MGGLIRDQIERFGSATWRARGASMAASIADGDLVRLIAPGRIRPGDVVMAVQPDQHLVLHRVRAVAGDLVHLRGDACRRPDHPVHLHEVVAVVDPSPPPTLRALAYTLLSSERP